MKLEILGCAGGEGIDRKATAFLLNDSILIDAGAVVNSLTLEQQNNIHYVLLTHAHMDHIKDLGFIVDNTFSSRTRPLEIISGSATINALKTHYFNGVIWPDFSRLPSPENAVLELVEEENQVSLNGLSITFIAVNHPGQSFGFLIEEIASNRSILITGDTGDTDLIWQVAKAKTNLQAIFADTAFPQAMQGLADISGHMTPIQLHEKILQHQLQHMDIYCYHLKPSFHEQVEAEIELLAQPGFKTLQQGQVLDF